MMSLLGTILLIGGIGYAIANGWLRPNYYMNRTMMPAETIHSFENIRLGFGAVVAGEAIRVIEYMNEGRTLMMLLPGIVMIIAVQWMVTYTNRIADLRNKML